MNSTNILQIIPCLHHSWGGPAKVVKDFTSKLVERGHSVTIYTSDYRLTEDSYRELAGFNVQFFKTVGLLTSANLFITRKLRTSLSKHLRDFDIIHLHEYRTYQNTVAYQTIRKSIIPYVIQAHGSLPRIIRFQVAKLFFDQVIGYKILKAASNAIALNKFEEKQYKEFGVNESKIRIVPNGIEPSEFKALPPKGKFRERYSIKDHEKVILFLGRIHKIKGLDVLVKAISLAKNDLQQIRLVIVGPDDGYLSALKNHIKRSGIEAHTIISGPIYGKARLEAFVDSDVYVLPSRYEVFGISLLEAQACGKPVIGADIPAIRSMIIENQSGLLFTQNDVKQLATKILYLINNPDIAKKIGTRAKQNAISNFNLENIIKCLELLYLEVLG